MQILDNTKAILLLTAPLLLGKNKIDTQLLSNKEYNQLAIFLKSINKQPADLLTSNLDNILNQYGRLENERIHQLLNRGFLLSQVLDYWYSRNIWVISRADKSYPYRLKSRLNEQAPPILYGCGDITLLDTGGLAIVGSRNIDDKLIQYTRNIAGLAASSGKMVISGGAKGTDSVAMWGALSNRGYACGILSDNLEKNALNPENRLALQEKRLVLVSANDPKSHFLIGNAMARNKYIYALSDIGLVINSDLNKGGTWAGAIEQLERYKQIPIYVRNSSEPSPGLNALNQKGAKWWKEPSSVKEFLDIFDRAFEEPTNVHQEQINMMFDDNLISEHTLEPPATLDDELFLLVKKLIKQNLTEPKGEKDLATLLNVNLSQMRIWLKRLISENILSKQGKPIQYILNKNTE